VSVTSANAQELIGSFSRYGTKIAVLCRRLKSLRPDEKAIVVSSWPRVLEVAHRALQEECIPSVVLVGSATQRANVVKRFQQSILSTAVSPSEEVGGITTTSSSTSSSTHVHVQSRGRRGANQSLSSSVTGGVGVRVLLIVASADCSGMTLSAANHLFLLDPVPRAEHVVQLVGRIARQGQTRAQTVYHMISEGTVEEGVLADRETKSTSSSSTSTSGKAVMTSSSTSTGTSATATNVTTVSRHSKLWSALQVLGIK
jgi:hypothetical protein